MTLRTRLTLGLLTIAVILVVPLLLATRSLDRLHDQTKALRDGDFAASLLLGQLREGLNGLRSAEIALLFVRRESSRDAMMERISTVEQMADSLERYGLHREAAEVRSSMDAARAGAAEEYEAAINGQVAVAESLSSQRVVPAITRAEQAMTAAEGALRTRTRERVVRAATAARNGTQAALIGLALALGAAAVIAFKLMQGIHRPVSELERGMRRVADGDFTVKLSIPPDRADEFGQLSASFGDMTRQLVELDKLKAEFVSVASHELKTPINVILGYTQLLQEELYGPLTDKQRNVANVLEKQTQTLSRLVRQLLDVTRFEAGGGKLDVRPVPLAGFLEHLEQSFQVLADQRNVRFIVTLHPGLPETVHWDADRMNEVMGNLLSNAFKFTERGGEVELTVLPVDHSVQLDVRDSGAGIPPDQVHRIFDKFFQADNQGAASQAGSGLGLAIAREIVEAHNGEITCDSTPGVGTTFTLVLPERATNGRRSSMKQHAMVEA